MTDPDNGDRQRPETIGNGSWSAQCGKQLEDLRAEFGLTQTELADLIGVDTRSVRYWERGRHPPSRINKAAIVKAFGGRDHPCWQEQRCEELAICLGVRDEPAEEEEPGVVGYECTGDGDPQVLTTATPADPPARAGRRRTRLVSFSVITVLVLVVVILTLLHLDAPVRVEVCNIPWHLVYRSGRVKILGAQPRNGAFYCEFPSTLTRTLIRDLDGDGKSEVLVCVIDTARSDKPSGQIRLECFSHHGKHLWTHFIDDTPAFRDGSVYSAHEWSLSALQCIDWSGDGNLEIAVLATHLMYPSMLVVVDAHGKRLCEYTNAGHMRSFAALPNDFYESMRRDADLPIPAPQSPGVALAISTQINEDPPACHLIILAPGFTSGAFPARTPHYQDAKLAPTTDGIFIRLRPSLVAQRHAAGHNWPENIDFDPTTRRIKVGTIEEPGGEAILRFFDSTLREVSIIPTDRFRNKYGAMQQQLDLASIDSELMAQSVETLDYWIDETWMPVRHPGAWSP